jgi:hypothetical protein
MRMAIRWLPLEAGGDTAAKTVEKLPTHPQLPKICSVGKVGSAAFVAMEFPEGKLLSTTLGEPLTAPGIRQLGAEMADALATVHADGAFHGEISADSILMLPDGRAVLWDVPLVIANRITDRRQEERFMRQLMHMASFIAPERARGCPASAAADVYALGAVLCVAAGAPLPPEETTLAVVHRIATGQWTPHVPASIPADLKGVLEQMLRADPHGRPTAREAVALLQTPAGSAPAPQLAIAPAAPAIPEAAVPPRTASATALEAVAPEVEAPAPAAVAPAVSPVVTARAMDLFGPTPIRVGGAAASEPPLASSRAPNPLAATIKVANPFPDGFPSPMVLPLKGRPPALPSARKTDPEMVAARAPAAVVAPSIEISTDQIKPSEVQFFERVEDPGPPELPDSDFEFDESVLRRPPLMLGLAAGLGGLLLAGTLVVVLNYPHRPESDAPTVAGKTPVVGADAEELVAPLAPASKPAPAQLKRFHPATSAPAPAPVAAKRRPLPAPPAPAKPAAPAPTASAAPPPSPEKERDFSFLSTDAQAPKSQLKRN